jgi:Carboxypeptidase regulatory-like domain
MLEDGLRKRMRSRWLGSGLAGLLVVGTAMTPGVARAQVQATTPAPAGAAGVQAGMTRVHGEVTDPDGALIPGATVTLTPSSGRAVTVKSGSDGSYSAAVMPGTYTVLVTMPGFASFTAPGVAIAATGGMTLNAKLQIGVQSQVVTVQANSVQLSTDPDSNASAVVLQGKDLDALSDDPDELSDELTALAGPSAGPNGGQIYVDGFTGGQLPPKSSIREIRVNQNPFSAEYDQLGYGRVEVFTKPGTDKMHGNFQVNGNASQFNSSNPLATGFQPPYHTLFMFGNLTGPLSKAASFNIGGTYRQIQTDEFTNTSILAATPGSTTLCAPGDASCVETPYQVSTYFPQTRADINPRVDLSLGQKNVLTTRYHYVNNSATNDGINNDSLPSSGYNTSTLSNILQMSDTETWNSNVISETRFEYEREHLSQTPLSTAPAVGVSGLFTGGGFNEQSLSDHQDHFEFQSYNSVQLKKNFIRFGGRLRATREAENTGAGTNGSFTYEAVADYLAGTPNQFTYTTVNNHKIGDTDTDLGMYAEDDWKAKPNLTISYGFRYETQNHLSDHHDIAPRIAFNYGLFRGKGAPKTVLRGGFGMFYTRFDQANVLTLEQENGVNTTVYTVENPSAACNPNAGTANFITDCGATSASQTTYTAASNLRTPYITEFAGGADQQVGRNGTLSVNYVHSQGVHQLATQNIGYNFADPMLSTAHYQYFSEGVFNQNQLIINGRVQTGKAISLFGYYSLNSAHGDTSGAGADITTPGNIAADYGRTTFDVKSRLFLAGSISLPRFIQFSPFMIQQSGTPYNITTGSDNNFDTFFNSRPDLVTGVAANGSTIKTIPGCGTFAQPGLVAGASVVPINSCTGPSLFTFNLRVTKTFGFGASTRPVASGNGGGPGGGPGGGGGHGDHGGHGGGPGGGGPGGNGQSTGKRYNLAFGVQVQNLFNNEDLSVPQGVLSSSNFGRSTQIYGQPYTTTSALRRITLQTSFYF